MAMFSPPAYVTDLPPAGQQQWSDQVQAFFSGETKYHYFFSPLTLPAGQAGIARLITWNGFPKKYTSIANADPLYRYEATDKLVTKDLGGRDYSMIYSAASGGGFNANGIKTFLFRDQDEYLEWKTYKDADNNLQKVVLTCDHPEYWSFISQYDPALLLSLYQKFVDPAVQMADLLFQTDVYVQGNQPNTYLNLKGQYNPFNKWNNTDGIMHLSHPANYLSAEIQLAAAATVLRHDPHTGALLTDPTQLCTCAQYGDPARNSDPTIGADINTLVRSGISVSISDPVALYIHDINEAAYTFPADLALKDFLTVVRGDASKGMMLRIEFAPPAGSGVTLDQVKINGVALQYGGQIADTITMVIYGLGYKFPDVGPTQTAACGQDVPDSAAPTAPPAAAHAAPLATPLFHSHKARR